MYESRSSFSDIEHLQMDQEFAKFTKNVEGGKD